MDETPTSQALSTRPEGETIARPLEHRALTIMPDQFTLAGSEATRLIAILSRVNLLPVQQPSGVMDGHFVSNQWLLSGVSWTLHNLWRQASILIECQVLQEALKFAQKHTFGNLTAKYLDDSSVFIRCHINALCSKQSCDGLTIHWQILISGHFYTWSVTLENCQSNKNTHRYSDEESQVPSSG